MVEDATRRNVLLAGGAALVAGGAFGMPITADPGNGSPDDTGRPDDAGPQNGGSSNERTIEWEGQGSEHATQDCPDQIGYWHFVLTRGGPTALEPGAELTVTFTDTDSVTVTGEFRGEGAGAMHFDVFKQGGGTVDSAEVTFSGGGPNAQLVISDGECLEDEKPPTVEEVYWQVDFGAGANPPLPPRYYPNDGLFALGSSEDGVVENPSFARTQSAGQLGDVSIEDMAFDFDDDDDPTEVTVRFTVNDSAPERDLHLAVFLLPGPFTEEEIDEQVLFDVISDTYDGGDSGELTLPLP